MLLLRLIKWNYPVKIYINLLYTNIPFCCCCCAEWIINIQNSNAHMRAQLFNLYGYIFTLKFARVMFRVRYASESSVLLVFCIQKNKKSACSRCSINAINWKIHCFFHVVKIYMRKTESFVYILLYGTCIYSITYLFSCMSPASLQTINLWLRIA